MPRGRYDVIIFGATSFVGGILARYIASQYGLNGDLKWALAGRSEERLRKVRGTLGAALGDKAGQVELLTADADDPQSLAALCEQTRVIVSTVGPYALYGEPLVKACVDAGIDYCDLTGEPQWIKRMLDKYEARAVETGARIVHCCGFDSIPSDMGVWYLQQQAQEKLGHMLPKVEMRVKAAKGGFSGGTVASLLQLAREAGKQPGIRKELMNPYCICPPDHGFRAAQNEVLGAVQHRATGTWTMPFIMAAINTRVVHRTNALRNKAYGERFQYSEGVFTGKGKKGRRIARIGSFALNAFMVLTFIGPTRSLLERFVLPKPGEGPSEKEQENGFFDLLFFGYDNKKEPAIITRVTGDKDPGYGFTAKMLGEAAACLAMDYHNRGKKRWAKGGFWTPGSIFGDVFMQRLENNAGMTFEVIDQGNKPVAEEKKAD